MRSVLLCPGQGAQFVGMGQDVADQFPGARAVFQAVDEALGFSLSQVMWQGPETELTLTHNAQPAILAHTLAVHEVVRPALDPLLAAGHSLGEYSAYSTAGSLELADAARLVRRRGELMLAAGQQREGTMTAVLGLNATEVEAVCRESSTGDSVVVAANINAPDQTVLSGDPDAVERAGARCKEAGAKRVLPLKVSGAFHSPLMEPAAVGLQTVLDSVELADPAFPIVANATAQPVSDAATARAQLGAQLTSPVKWVASMQYAAQTAGEPARFLEIGPGKVLSGLLKRIVPGAEPQSLGSAQDITRFLEALG